MDAASDLPVDEEDETDLAEADGPAVEPVDGPVDDASPSLPEPIEEKEEDPEEAIRKWAFSSAKETLRLCGELLDTRPTRALSLIELSTNLTRKLVVELAEPEAELRDPLSKTARLDPTRIFNPYNGGRNLIATAGIAYGDTDGDEPENPYARELRRQQRFADARQGLRQARAEERPRQHPNVELARTYAAGLSYTLLASADLPEVLEAVRAQLREHLSEELVALIGATKASPEGPRAPTLDPVTDLAEAASALTGEEKGFEELDEPSDDVADFPVDGLSEEAPSFEDLLDDKATFRLEAVDAEVGDADVDEIDAALEADDAEEAAEAEEDEGQDDDLVVRVNYATGDLVVRDPQDNLEAEEQRRAAEYDPEGHHLFGHDLRTHRGRRELMRELRRQRRMAEIPITRDEFIRNRGRT